MAKTFSKDFSENKKRIDALFHVDKSFDLIYRVITIGGKSACFYFIDGFCKETAMYHEISISVNNAQTEEELNAVLLNAYNKFDINLPWTGDFDAFMSNKDNMLVFE